MRFSLTRLLSNARTFTYKIAEPYWTHNLTGNPLRAEAALTADEAKLYLRQMTEIRRLENAANALYKERLVRGFLHLSIGQEAVGVGIKAALKKNDAMISSYRSHGLTYLMGVSMEKILAELLGSSEGCSRGKGGSMHTYGPNFYGGCAIVGAQVPLGTGVAFAFKYRNEDNVCVALYGDGAANQGQVYEAFNMARLMQLPVIYVCENNEYGMGTAVSIASANVEFYKRGDLIPGIRVDGMDVIAVREATRFAREWCSDGKGPIILEMQTYRYMGHSMSDPGTSYRTRAEIQERRKRDPIGQFRQKILDMGITNEADLKAMDEEISTEVRNAEEAARKAPKPDPSELFTDVYSQPVKNLVLRGVDMAMSADMSEK